MKNNNDTYLYSGEDIVISLNNLNNKNTYKVENPIGENEKWIKTQIKDIVSNIKNEENIVIPINIDNNHWAGLVLKKNAGIIEAHYNDPLGNTMQDKNPILHRELLSNGIDLKNIHDYKLTQQDNPYDCGPCTVLNLHDLAEGNKLRNSDNIKDAISKQRKDLANLTKTNLSSSLSSAHKVETSVDNDELSMTIAISDAAEKIKNRENNAITIPIKTGNDLVQLVLKDNNGAIEVTYDDPSGKSMNEKVPELYQILLNNDINPANIHDNKSVQQNASQTLLSNKEDNASIQPITQQRLSLANGSQETKNIHENKSVQQNTSQTNSLSNKEDNASIQPITQQRLSLANGSQETKNINFVKLLVNKTAKLFKKVSNYVSTLFSGRTEQRGDQGVSREEMQKSYNANKKINNLDLNEKIVPLTKIRYKNPNKSISR